MHRNQFLLTFLGGMSRKNPRIQPQSFGARLATIPITRSPAEPKTMNDAVLLVMPLLAVSCFICLGYLSLVVMRPPPRPPPVFCQWGGWAAGTTSRSHTEGMWL